MPRPHRIELLSIVIPVYNEEDNLPALCERCRAVVRQIGLPAEIILVDDGSRDASAELIRAAAADPLFVGVILNRNYGQHAAVMAGFSRARGDLIVTLDADLQNPPEEIPKLIQAAEEGYEVVGTVRQLRQDSLFRRLASRVVNNFVRRATGVQMSDYGCMLRAYRRHIVDTMLRCDERSTFIPMLANSFARHTTEIPVRHEERAAGDSKYSVLKLINLQFDLLTAMTTAPLRLLSFIGGAIAAAGTLFALLLLALRIIKGAAWGVDGVFPLFAILFIFIGAQFMSFGLLGEYIGRIYTDVRARPRFIIEETIAQGTGHSAATEPQPDAAAPSHP
ncbi:MAG: glycosyltransferase [Betaproteobacteria bacterium]|nr:glycosyltransferase [Betaproteobacteria bacterium]MCL2886425.1 glycosyltransferase [Betaproteobacteria bacterium]